LDMGFIPDIERIIGLLPPLRQTLLFSATMPPEIRRLAARFLSNPKEIAVSRPATTAETVDQRLVRVAMRDKRAALRALLRSEQPRNALVFCNRKRDVGIVCRSLQRHGFSAGQLHGDMVQSARQETLEGFKRGDPVVLVCSDVAARGIDIDQLSHVFNFDVPHHAEDYVHRIGRTGRAGRAGKSITLATPEEAKSLSAVEKLIGRPIEPLAVDLGDRTDADSEEAEEPRGGPRHGRRSSQPARKAAPKPPARPAPPPRREPPPKPPEAEAKPRRARPAPRQEREDPPVVGLGDHVPAFLRPPKPKR
ncbi:MAG: DEAD/DEAH box helicase, partial [Rhodospirillaceae bacterium]|nr:DEAD/DEAH box helicase [Rhodospirillaceae bacterium]